MLGVHPKLQVSSHALPLQCKETGAHRHDRYGPPDTHSGLISSPRCLGTQRAPLMSMARPAYARCLTHHGRGPLLLGVRFPGSSSSSHRYVQPWDTQCRELGWLSTERWGKTGTPRRARTGRKGEAGSERKRREREARGARERATAVARGLGWCGWESHGDPLGDPRGGCVCAEFGRAVVGH